MLTRARFVASAVAVVAVLAQVSACTKDKTEDNGQPDGGGATGGGGAAGAGGGAGAGGSAGSAGAGGTGGGGGMAGAGGSTAAACPGITAASAEAAFAQLETGATQVNLDPAGCAKYERTKSGTLVAHEALSMNGTQRMVFDRTTTEGHGKYDRNLDGTFDYYIDITLDSVPGDMLVVETWGESAPSKPDRRETAKVVGDNVHVDVEEFDSTGQLVSSSSYDGPRKQQQNVTFDPPSGAGACDAAMQAAVKQAFKNALDKGRQCMWNFGQGDAADYLAEVASTKGIRIKCVDSGGKFCAEASKWDTIMGGFAGSTLDIDIDPSLIGNAAACGSMEGTLFHEILHSYYGMHSAYDVKNGTYMNEAKQKDKLYACQAVCFEPDKATKCQCAACYGTNNPCDPNCGKYQDCNKDQAQCQCLSNPGYYDSYSLCTVGCPKGISCFASSCKNDFQCK